VNDSTHGAEAPPLTAPPPGHAPDKRGLQRAHRLRIPKHVPCGEPDDRLCGQRAEQGRQPGQAGQFLPAPLLVLNQAGVVMGAAYRDRLASVAGASAGSVMRFGVSTVRPSEDAAALAHRMGHAG
jgi:hypothetical protein